MSESQNIKSGTEGSAGVACSARLKPRWISLRRQKPREEDSCAGWVIYISATGQLYFNFWNYYWGTSPHINIVAWAPIPFWGGEGLEKAKRPKRQNVNIQP